MIQNTTGIIEINGAKGFLLKGKEGRDEM